MSSITQVKLTYNQFRSKFKGLGLTNLSIGQVWSRLIQKNKYIMYIIYKLNFLCLLMLRKIYCIRFELLLISLTVSMTDIIRHEITFISLRRFVLRIKLNINVIQEN